MIRTKKIFLSDLKNGQTAIIDKIHENEIKRQLLEMGFARHKMVKLVSRAPFGDPLLIEINGYKLMLRKKEAGLVELKNDADE